MHAAEPGQYHNNLLHLSTMYETILMEAVHGDQARPEWLDMVADKVGEARHAFILAVETSSVKPMRRQRQHRRRR